MIVVAAELALHDIPEDVAVAVCQSIPFAAGTTPKRKVRKSIPSFVRWAYNPPDGLPVLTGCPKAEASTDSSKGGRLRAAFVDYCNDDCYPCPIFKARRVPELSIIRSEYEPILLSAIWMSRGLGPETRRVWLTVAAIAADASTPDIQASSNYLVNRLGGTLSARTIRYHVSKLEQRGLLKRLNRRNGTLRVLALTESAIADLENDLGVVAAARWNRIEANWDTLRKAIELPEWPLDAAA